MHHTELRAIAKRKRLEAEALDKAAAHMDPDRRARARLEATTLRRKAVELEMAAQRSEAIGA